MGASCCLVMILGKFLLALAIEAGSRIRGRRGGGEFTDFCLLSIVLFREHSW